MPEGAPTEAPAGFVQMCADLPGECVSPAQAVSGAADPGAMQGEAAWHLVKTVNDRVNARIVWTADRGADRWERPVNGRGDCEDFAIEKRDELIAAGFPAARLFFAIGYLRGAGLHAVLVASTDRGDVVLDSLDPRLRQWQSSPYVWLIRQSETAANEWRTIPASETKLG